MDVAERIEQAKREYRSTMRFYVEYNRKKDAQSQAHGKWKFCAKRGGSKMSEIIQVMQPSRQFLNEALCPS